MSSAKYGVQQIEDFGTRCQFYSMGGLRDGWIMPDGVGVDYAGYAQLRFEPETITTDDAIGLMRARCAVAQQNFATLDFGYTFTEAQGWIDEGDKLVGVCYAIKDGERSQLEFKVSFMEGSASSTSTNLFNVSDALANDEAWAPMFSPWRHGGWYVSNLQKPCGSIGCVSNNYDDQIGRAHV